MPLVYRAMVPDDVPAVLETRFATIENPITLAELERNYGVTPAGIAAALAGDVGGWLCEDGARVAGFAMGDRNSGEVLVVAVHPDYERRGVGKQVLGRICEWLFTAGHARAWLCSNPDPALRAHGFYRHLGWRATGARRGDDEVLELARADFDRD